MATVSLHEIIDTLIKVITRDSNSESFYPSDLIRWPYIQEAHDVLRSSSTRPSLIVRIFQYRANHVHALSPVYARFLFRESSSSGFDNLLQYPVNALPSCMRNSNAVHVSSSSIISEITAERKWSAPSQGVELRTQGKTWMRRLRTSIG